jgi:hypothetical protein
MSSIIVISVIVSIVVSILTGRIILLLQYKLTNAGFRVNKVAAATHEIMVLSNVERKDGDVINSFRYSAGLFLYRCHKAFDAGQTENSLYPLLTDNIEKEVDSWRFYNTHVRPVINDINNNSFIGWLPTIEMRRLRSLVKLCNQVEYVISEIALINQENRTKYMLGVGLDLVQFVNYDNQKELQPVKDAYEVLRKDWFRWISFLPKSKDNIE